MLSELLFELGTEELPSGAVKPLADALVNNMKAVFAKSQLSFGDVRCFATPRRLAVLMQDLQTMQASQEISRRGPACASSIDANGKPLPALLGFAKSCGVGVEQLSKVKTDKGEWWVYDTVQPGLKTVDLLPLLIKEAVTSLPIAKPMRWGNGLDEFARPVHWGVLLLGNEVVHCDLFGIKTDRYSHGHRFHHPEAMAIPSPNAYESALHDGYVVADFAARRQLILKQVQALAASRQAIAIMPDELVDEVTSIVEWPHALLIDFSPEFLEVPAEALIASMQSHQKCFALKNQAGELLPHFITVANIDSKHAASVVLGNENVMRARLSDAAFFYRQDRKHPLSHYADATQHVVFQSQLGTLADKATRVQKLAVFFANMFDINPEQATRAAQLSKCDLMTGMVNEFPELQGLMGYYYAQHDGEDEAVAVALKEQYLPRFAADQLPSSKLGMVLSLADRLDTLVGTFAIGQRPTGVKDPFKSRRNALAVVRMLIELDHPLTLSHMIQQARDAYGSQLPEVDHALNELQVFILDRLESYYQNQGVSSEIVKAVRARQKECLFDLDKRIKAVLDFMQLPAAAALAAACKRVNNLLQHATFKEGKIQSHLLEAGAETNLFEQLHRLEQQMPAHDQSNNYVETLNQLATLRDYVDAYFEHVMVMVDNDELRQNRLRLLAHMQRLLQGVADISLLPTGV